MIANISIDIKGLEAYQYKLTKLAGYLPRARDFFTYVGEDIHEIEERTWEEGQSSWQEWSPAYAAWRNGRLTTGASFFTGSGRRERGPGGRFTGRMAAGSDILDLSGALRADMTERYKVPPHDRGVVVGTDLDYAQYHMTGAIMGGWAKGAVLPVRDFVGWTQSDFRRWRRARESWMKYQVWRAELGGSSEWQMQKRVR
jgi:phage gpG-like protein